MHDRISVPVGAMNVEFVKGFMIYTPPQHRVFLRPYEAHVHTDDVNRLISLTNGGVNISANSLATIANNLISPSHTPHSEFNIDNGFDNPRYAFFFQLQITDVLSVTDEIITGFTNYDGISRMGEIDPDLVFYVNNRFVLKSQPRQSGYEPLRIVRGNSCILAPSQNEMSVVLRPEDITGFQEKVLVSEGLMGRAMDYRMYNGPNTVAKLGELRHGSANSYLADTLGAYKQGYFSDNGPEMDPYSSMDSGSFQFHQKITRVYENLARSNDAIYATYAIELAGGAPDLTKVSEFRYRDIISRWGLNADSRITIKRPPLSAPILRLSDYNQHWGGSDTETIVAHELSHTLPGMMGQFMLSRVEFSINNVVMGGGVNYIPLDFTSMFDDTGVTMPQIEGFKAQVMRNIVEGIILSKPDIATFDLRVTADLLNNAEITISINGYQHTPFIAPFFCTSHYTPLIGENYDNLSDLSNDVHGLGELIVDVISNERATVRKPLIFDYHSPQAQAIPSQQSSALNMVATWNSSQN